MPGKTTLCLSGHPPTDTPAAFHLLATVSDAAVSAGAGALSAEAPASITAILRENQNPSAKSVTRELPRPSAKTRSARAAGPHRSPRQAGCRPLALAAPRASAPLSPPGAEASSGGGENRALCAGASLGVTEDARVWEPGVGGSDQEGEHFKSRAPSPGRWEPIKSPDGRVFP